MASRQIPPPRPSGPRPGRPRRGARHDSDSLIDWTQPEQNAHVLDWRQRAHEFGIVPADDIADPLNVAIKLWVNDVIKQDSHTSKMIFTLAEQIAHLSTLMTLQAGDLILTGTPAGVGLARKEFLKPGDVVKVWIEGIGTLTNTCV